MLSVLWGSTPPEPSEPSEPKDPKSDEPNEDKEPESDDPSDDRDPESDEPKEVIAPVLDDIWNMLVGFAGFAGFSSFFSAALPGLKDLNPGAFSAGFSSFFAAPKGLKGPEAAEATADGFSEAADAAEAAGLKDLEPTAGLDDAADVFFSPIGLNGLGVDAAKADGFSEAGSSVSAEARCAAGLKDLEPTAGLDEEVVVFFSLIGLNGLGVDAAKADGFSFVSEAAVAAGAVVLKDLEPTAGLGDPSSVFFALKGLNGLGAEGIEGEDFSEDVRPAAKRGTGFSDVRGEAGPCSLPHFQQNFAPLYRTSPQLSQVYRGVPHSLQDLAPSGSSLPQFMQYIILLLVCPLYKSILLYTDKIIIPSDINSLIIFCSLRTVDFRISYEYPCS